MDLRPKVSSSRRFAERLVRFRLLLAILLLGGFFWGLDDLVKVSRFWRDDARVALRLVVTLLAERHDSVRELVPWAMLSFAGSVGWCAWRFLSAKKTGLFLVLLSLPAWLFTYFGWEPRVHALVAEVGECAAELRGRFWGCHVDVADDAELEPRNLSEPPRRPASA